MRRKAPVNETLDLIRDVCGPEVVEKLVTAFGGTTIKLAVSAGLDSPNVNAIGAEAAAKIAREVGTGKFTVPSFCIARREAEIVRLKALGQSTSTVARKLGIHSRTVERHMRQARIHGLVG